jgi:hypothetical protein
VMMSSAIPSATNSCSGFPLMLVNGNTATEGLSGGTRSFARRSSSTYVLRISTGFRASRTAPTKRTPLPMMVRISRGCSPLSPITRRTALIRVAIVDSDTIRPPQTAVSRSSLLTTRSRLPTKNTRRSNTCGSIDNSAAPRRSSRRSVSRA